MASREELILWDNANRAYAAGSLRKALELYKGVGNYSKVLFNIGMVYVKANDFASSEVMFSQCIEQDEYLAVAYMQKGYSLFQLRDYFLAEKCFDFALKLLLDNDYIDYGQLGMKFKLYRVELMFNLAMCYRQTGDKQKEMKNIAYVEQNAGTSVQRQVCANSSRPGEVTLFTVPNDRIFEIPEAKAKNLIKKDFLNNARLVVDNENSGNEAGFIGFSGATILDPNLNSDDGQTLVKNKTTKKSPAISLNDLQIDGPIKTGRRPSEPSLGTRKQSLYNSSSRSFPVSPDPPPATSGSPRRSPLKSTFTEEDYSYSSAQKIQLPSTSTARSSPAIRRSPELSNRSLNVVGSGYDNNGDIVKIKIHADKKTKIVNAPLTIQLEHLQEIIKTKLKLDYQPEFTFQDEDEPDLFISIGDDEDLEIALNTPNRIAHLYLQQNVLDLYGK